MDEDCSPWKRKTLSACTSSTEKKDGHLVQSEQANDVDCSPRVKRRALSYNPSTSWKIGTHLHKKTSVPTMFDSVMSRVNDLTDDELTNIFIKLPVKLVHRLKCVCKRWLSLISDPGFARSYAIMHSNIVRSAPQDQDGPIDITKVLVFGIKQIGGGEIHGLPLLNDMITVESSSSSMRPFPLDFIAPRIQHPHPPAHHSANPSGQFEVMLVKLMFKGVCNDLLLAQAIYADSLAVTYGKPLYSIFYVYNVVTKHWVELPMLPLVGHAGLTCYHLQDSQGSGEKVTRIWANCGDSDKPNLSAIYNPDKVEFTVVVMSKEEGHKVFIIHVFSSMSGTGDWTVFRVPFPSGYLWHNDISIQRVVVANGMFHWNGNADIVAYDPFNRPDQCDVIPLPRSSSDRCRKSFYYTFGLFLAATLEGRLRVVNFSMGRFSVWELVDYANKVWELKYDINVNDKSDAFYGLKFRSFAAGGDKAYFASSNLPIMLWDLRNGSLHTVFRCLSCDTLTEDDDSNSTEGDDDSNYPIDDDYDDDDDHCRCSISNVDLCCLTPWPTPVSVLR